MLSIATKVIIQIASKLGAKPWRASVPPTVCIIGNVLIDILFQSFYLLFRNGWPSDTIHTMMLDRERQLVLFLLRWILLSLVIILMWRFTRITIKFQGSSFCRTEVKILINHEGFLIFVYCCLHLQLKKLVFSISGEFCFHKWLILSNRKPKKAR